MCIDHVCCMCVYACVYVCCVCVLRVCCVWVWVWVCGVCLEEDFVLCSLWPHLSSPGRQVCATEPDLKHRWYFIPSPRPINTIQSLIISSSCFDMLLT